MDRTARAFVERDSAGSADKACPLGECDGSTFITDETTRTSRPCRCRPIVLAERRVAQVRGGMGRRYAHVSFDRPPLPEIADRAPAVVRAVRRFCDRINEHLDDGASAWLYGDKGTGKTTLAMLIARYAGESRRTVAAYNTSSLLNAIRATYRDDSPISTVALLEQFATVDLLVLDDIAVPRPTDWVLEQLYVLVNTRYEEERSIVVTSDVGGTVERMIEKETDETVVKTKAGDALKPSGIDHEVALGELIGHRTVSRISEMAGDNRFPLFGRDARYSEFRPA